MGVPGSGGGSHKASNEVNSRTGDSSGKTLDACTTIFVHFLCFQPVYYVSRELYMYRLSPCHASFVWVWAFDLYPDFCFP